MNKPTRAIQVSSQLTDCKQQFKPVTSTSLIHLGEVREDAAVTRYKKCNFSLYFNRFKIYELLGMQVVALRCPKFRNADKWI